MTSHREVVLYHRAETTVTTTVFESNGRRYPVAELHSPHRVEPEGWLQPRVFELWARFRGRPVRLFRSRKEREFGEVCRALVRAREHAGLT